MQNSILEKCVAELKKESPKIDYILGMLETLIQLGGAAPTPSGLSNLTPHVNVKETPATIPETESDLLARYSGGPFGNIRS